MSTVLHVKTVKGGIADLHAASLKKESYIGSQGSIKKQMSMYVSALLHMALTALSDRKCNLLFNDYFNNLKLHGKNNIGEI